METEQTEKLMDNKIKERSRRFCCKVFADRKLGWGIDVYSIDGVRLAMKLQGQTLFYHYSLRADVVAMTD